VEELRRQHLSAIMADQSSFSLYMDNTRPTPRPWTARRRVSRYVDSYTVQSCMDTTRPYPGHGLPGDVSAGRQLHSTELHGHHPPLLRPWTARRRVSRYVDSYTVQSCMDTTRPHPGNGLPGDGSSGRQLHSTEMHEHHPPAPRS
jgi:hypothetical protein